MAVVLVEGEKEIPSLLSSESTSKAPPPRGAKTGAASTHTPKYVFLRGFLMCIGTLMAAPFLI